MRLTSAILHASVASRVPLPSRFLHHQARMAGPVETAIRAKIESNFQPTRLEIHNDSHLHAHHKAMVDSTSQETHFRLIIASQAFKECKGLASRHRLVNTLLKEELAKEGGIHALQLKTMTPEEDERQQLASQGTKSVEATTCKAPS